MPRNVMVASARYQTWAALRPSNVSLVRESKSSDGGAAHLGVLGLRMAVIAAVRPDRMSRLRESTGGAVMPISTAGEFAG
jgi:hypothetical protein